MTELSANALPVHVDAQKRRFRIDDLLDYFIPLALQFSPEAHRRARMFMLSHVFGPILGNVIPLYIYYTGISRDYRFWVFFLSVLAFWAYPFILRKTQRYQLLAFISVQNLIFCVLWACYAFGGALSPFVPWILIFPLLAFLYLPTTGIIRNVLLVQIFGSVALFIAIIVSRVSLPEVNLGEMQIIGLVSLFSVAIYFAMMSTYFAKMFYDQREFTRELNGLVLASDNIMNLTAAANTARTAKADFVANMSHELRTPLNAIIGYSQLLLEEATDEKDEQSIADLRNVNGAGSELLRLIDNILDYSRIEAGKMPIAKHPDRLQNHLHRWTTNLSGLLAARNCALVVSGEARESPAFVTDWGILINLLTQLALGMTADLDGGVVTLGLFNSRRDSMAFTMVVVGSDGHSQTPVILSDAFEHADDSSPTKYSMAGINNALAAKFAQLIDGTIETTILPGNVAASLVTINAAVDTIDQIAA
jgi:signal transduction histidine kinase